MRPWSFSDFEPRPSQVRSSPNSRHAATASACRFCANSGSRGGLIDASYGHGPTLDEAKAAFTLALILMKCIATHVDFGLSRLSTPANLLVLLQRYIPT